MYYGAGLLSNFDKYPENKKSSMSSKHTKKRQKGEDGSTKQSYQVPGILQEIAVSFIQMINLLSM